MAYPMTMAAVFIAGPAPGVPGMRVFKHTLWWLDGGVYEEG